MPVESKITQAFVVLIQDRHVDVDVEIFADEGEAIQRAQKLANEYCHHKEDYSEMAHPMPADWIFHATYSCEGDSISVLRKVIE